MSSRATSSARPNAAAARLGGVSRSDQGGGGSGRRTFRFFCMSARARQHERKKVASATDEQACAGLELMLTTEESSFVGEVKA